MSLLAWFFVTGMYSAVCAFNIWWFFRKHNNLVAAHATEIAISDNRADVWRDKYYDLGRRFNHAKGKHADEIDALELEIAYLRNEVERRHEQADSWKDISVAGARQVQFWLFECATAAGEIDALKKKLS